MLYLSLNFHIVTTAVCKQTSNICVFNFLSSFVTHYDSIFKILSKIWNGRDNRCMAFYFTSTLPCYRDMLSNIPVKPNLISHYYNSCLAFSSCHCNSDTNLTICIFTSVKTFQHLWNLSNLHLLMLSLHLVFSSIPQWYSTLLI